MRIIRSLMSVLLVFTISIFIITAAQSVVMRSSETYLFYYNDSRAVDSIYTELTNSEMADAMAGFMNSFRPQEFQIYENTGYDLEPLFNEDEGYNMLKVKRCADIILLCSFASFIISMAIYIYFLKQKMKRPVRISFNVSIALTLGLMIFNVIILTTKEGIAKLSSYIGLLTLPEDSELLAITGSGLVFMMVVFFILFTLVLFALCWYVTYRFTRPERIFY